MSCSSCPRHDCAGHFLRVKSTDTTFEPSSATSAGAASPRAESDVEMVAAGQGARLLDLAEHPSDDVAQRFLDDLVVGDQTFGRLLAHRLKVVTRRRRRSSAMRVSPPQFCLDAALCPA